MAQPSISNIGETSVSWQITGLSSYWTTANYQSAYIQIDGRSSSPVYPPSSGTSYSTGTGSFSGLTAGTTYTVYGYVVAANGQTYSAGSTTFTTISTRPQNFSWTYSKISGNNFNLYASEWNTFTTRINDFRRYKGLANYSFTTAVSGSDFYSYMFNQAVTAINAMNPPTSTPTSKSSGMDIYASYLNGLRDSLNSIQ